MPRLTPNSIVKAAALQSRLEKIRQRGWEFAVDDVSVGLAALAVPVLDGRGQLVAAISASGLTPQMQTPAGRPVHLDLMLAAAEKIASAIR